MKKPLIYVTRKLPEKLLKPYEEQLQFKMWKEADTPVPSDVLYKEISKADGMLSTITENIDADFLDHASHLKVIANMAVGYDNINVAAANEHNIIVTNTPDVLTETTADLAFTLLLATARRIVEASQVIKESSWGIGHHLCLQVAISMIKLSELLVWVALVKP